MEKPTKQVTWTLEKCKSEALKYPSHHKWSLESKYSYRKASAKGWLYLCPAGKFDSYKLPREQGYWTYDRCREESAKYSSIAEWHKHSRGSMKSAKRNGWYKELCLHYVKPTPVFTYDECKRVASLCGSFREWLQKYPECYRYAVQNGWKDDLGNFLQRVDRTIWTYEKCVISALHHKSVKSWMKTSYGAYKKCREKGWYQSVVSLIESVERDNDADIIYMWKAINCFYNGEQVYKIGVTSSGVGIKRIKQVMRSSGYDSEIVFMHNVGRKKAYEVEANLLELGVNPKFSKFDGSTEFRAMSDQDVRIAKALVFGESIRG
jgi:hypothetical protein